MVLDYFPEGAASIVIDSRLYLGYGFQALLSPPGMWKIFQPRMPSSMLL